MKLKINFLRVAPFFGIVSIGLVLFSLYTMFLGKGFKLGTDFKGGIEFTVTFNTAITVEEIAKAFKEKDLSVEIQPVIAEKPRFFISTSLQGEIDEEKEGMRENDIRKNTELAIEAILKSIQGPDNMTIDQVRSVGGVVSSENTDKAFKIVFWVTLFIIGYITIRFKFQYGLAAIIAVSHDVILMLGALIITDSEINVYTITAVLTIFGYSVNDTIILFDRIREYISEKAYADFNTTVNEAINSVLTRTLITSMTTLVVVVALFYNSQGGLHDFSFALIVGLVVGTYSSIYVASNFMVFWNKYKPLM